MLGSDSPDHSPDTGGVDVPRGTSTPPVVVPEAAAEVFGPALPLAQRYAEILAGDGVVRGLIGPREVPRLWERHVLNCAGLRTLVPEGASVVDVGSGAGLPGIPLALARPDVEVVLLEPLERRYHFLREVVSALSLGERCRVVRGRAEEVRGELSGDVVTARAVAPLDKLAGWTLPLTRTGGQVLAIKGRSAGEEVERAWPALRRWGVPEVPEVLTAETGVPDEDLTVVRIARGSGPLRLPRAGASGSAPRAAGGKASGAGTPGSGRAGAGGSRGKKTGTGTSPAASKDRRRGRGSGAGREH